MSCLILGAGPNQLELIKKVKSRGIFAVVVTPNRDDPGVLTADAHINEDIRNVAGIIKKCKGFNPTLCVTDQSDVGAMSQASICTELSLPSVSKAIIETFCDKYKCYKAIAITGNKFHPETVYFGSVVAASSYLQRLTSERCNWIVKPVNSQGSKGVTRLGSADDIGALTQAMVESAGAGFVIQQYVVGRHFSVDAVVVGSAYSTLVIAEKSKYIGNSNLDKRLVLTSANHYAAQQSILALHRQVVETLALPFGLTHGEYILSEDGTAYLIEIAARGGGGNISGKIIEYVTGFSPQDFIIDSALGRPQKILVDSNSQRCAILHFFDADADIKDSPDFAECPMLLHYEYRVSGGRSLAPRDSRSRPGYFIVGGETLEEAIENETHVLERVTLEMNRSQHGTI